jgi:hypothetical protein
VAEIADNRKRADSAKNFPCGILRKTARVCILGSMTSLSFGGQVPEWTLGDRLRKAREHANASPATTAIYTRVDDEELRAAVDALLIPLRVAS